MVFECSTHFTSRSNPAKKKGENHEREMKMTAYFLRISFWFAISSFSLDCNDSFFNWSSVKDLRWFSIVRFASSRHFSCNRSSFKHYSTLYEICIPYASVQVQWCSSIFESSQPLAEGWSEELTSAHSTEILIQPLWKRNEGMKKCYFGSFVQHLFAFLSETCCWFWSKS